MRSQKLCSKTLCSQRQNIVQQNIVQKNIVQSKTVQQNIVQPNTAQPKVILMQQNIALGKMIFNQKTVTMFSIKSFAINQHNHKKLFIWELFYCFSNLALQDNIFLFCYSSTRFWRGFFFLLFSEKLKFTSVDRECSPWTRGTETI